MSSTLELFPMVEIEWWSFGMKEILLVRSFVEFQKCLAGRLALVRLHQYV